MRQGFASSKFWLLKVGEGSDWLVLFDALFGKPYTAFITGVPSRSLIVAFPLPLPLTSRGNSSLHSQESGTTSPGHNVRTLTGNDDCAARSAGTIEGDTEPTFVLGGVDRLGSLECLTASMGFLGETCATPGGPILASVCGRRLAEGITGWGKGGCTRCGADLQSLMWVPSTGGMDIFSA
eukprot:CAMPEP_0172796372 /NCGR_PEP_ID=MMETSP1074-20121228/210954_1 /TAXON_ID=2916 /ORGANISM="Ceratium fusus, Strain PA161109" /LENGTH=179 /DNA_ID=CAMNT_0013633465 /DNA_START=400 /DNA_END=942 /DNA_ORIENTATION=-